MSAWWSYVSSHVGVEKTKVNKNIIPIRLFVKDFTSVMFSPGNFILGAGCVGGSSAFSLAIFLSLGSWDFLPCLVLYYHNTVLCSPCLVRGIGCSNGRYRYIQNSWHMCVLYHQYGVLSIILEQISYIRIVPHPRLHVYNVYGIKE